MDLVAIIATVILLATLLTLIFSFAAYVITRSKALLSEKGDGKEPEEQNETEMNERVFFERYTPGETLDIELDSDTGGGDGQWM